jgi:hypothetical protein
MVLSLGFYSSATTNPVPNEVDVRMLRTADQERAWLSGSKSWREAKTIMQRIRETQERQSDLLQEQRTLTEQKTALFTSVADTSVEPPGSLRQDLSKIAIRSAEIDAEIEMNEEMLAKLWTVYEGKKKVLSRQEVSARPERMMDICKHAQDTIKDLGGILSEKVQEVLTELATLYLLQHRASQMSGSAFNLAEITERMFKELESETPEFSTKPAVDVGTTSTQLVGPPWNEGRPAVEVLAPGSLVASTTIFPQGAKAG